MPALTNSKKDEIADALANEAMRAKRAELRAREDTFGRRCLVKTYGEDALARIRLLPEGWLPMVNAIHVGRYPSTCVRLTEAVPLPVSHYEDVAKVVLEGWWCGLFQEMAETEEAARSLRREIRTALNPITTVKRLREVWPEAAALISDDDAKSSTLPDDVERIANLRRRLAP